MRKIGISGLISSLIVLMVIFAFREEEQKPKLSYDPLPLPLPHYEFLNLAENVLHFPQQPNSFSDVWESLDRALFEDSASFNIVHMGGSHVQAGVLSERLREHFQNISPGMDAKRGLFFPFKLAKTNGPSNLRFERIGSWDAQRCAHNRHNAIWGMCGMEVSSISDTCGLDLYAIRTDSSRYGFHSFTLIHNIEIQADQSLLKADRIEVDSTLRTTTYHWNTIQDSLSLRFYPQEGEEVRIFGGLLDHQKGGIAYHEIGVNGASTKSYLRCEKMPKELELLQADLVVFGIGINDAYMSQSNFDREEFKLRYKAIAEQFRAVKENVQFLWITNNDSYYRRRYPNKNAFAVQEAMYELAEEYDGAVYDLFEVMGGLGSISDWERAGLAKADKIHFSRKGYVLQADMMFEAIRQAYGKHLEEKYLTNNIK
jgi:lysophospholipase L1-like esterase